MPSIITTALVQEETERLRSQWHTTETEIILPAGVGEIDLFDRQQPETVIAVCRRSRTISDADRLRKYLARFSLTREQITGC